MSDLKDPRVLFAAERTLFAWNRTALALIAFGFVLERTSLLLRLLEHDESTNTLFAPTFLLGLCFIFVGAICAAFSARQYNGILKTLTPAEFPQGYKARWGLAVNIVVALLGLALMAALIARHV